MAKAAAAAVAIAAFAFDKNLAIPEIKSRRGGPSETSQKLMAMEVGDSFLDAITVADTITDPAERAKSFNEQASKAKNRVGGVIRRIKESNKERNFVALVVGDATYGYGVRVWRKADTAPAAEGTAPAAGAEAAA